MAKVSGRGKQRSKRQLVIEKFTRKVKRIPEPILRDFMRKAAEKLPTRILKDFIKKIPKVKPKIIAPEEEVFREAFEEEHPTPELISELESKKPEDYFIAKFPRWDRMTKKELKKAVHGYFKVRDVPERKPVADWVRWRLKQPKRKKRART